jgi:hypothetical protein
MTRAKILVTLLACPACFALSCSDSGATATFDATVDDTASIDSAAEDAGPDATDGAADTTRADTARDDTAAAADTGPPADTFRPDLGLDAAGTFECGAERCGATFQFCQIDTAPGTGRHCVALPVSCFAFPSCPCVTTKTCGAETKGTCTDVSGAITVQCK